MITPVNILAIIVCYLLGSVPSSVWVGQLFYRIDVREHGSGNAGATNTFRVLGKKAGIPVLIFDTLKGWLAVQSTNLFSDYASGSDELLKLKLLLGSAALLGHIYPIYVGFRGGKGVATLLGIVLAANHEAALLSIVVFLIVFLTSNYVSLSSIIAAFAFPAIVILVLGTANSSMVVFSLFIAFLVLLTHQKNIERLLNNKESKIKIYKKKEEEESTSVPQN
ncbi:MAG: glycerol-3-phosphate 1-O-acyltransferase PlsY [Bacteroidota bacterium]